MRTNSKTNYMQLLMSWCSECSRMKQ